MKRALALMLAVVLVMSLGITAFAAETGTITIDNATIGQDYYLYKIFDAEYQIDSNNNIIQNSDGKDVIIYKIAPGDKFYEAMFGTNGTASTYFEYDDVSDIVLKRDVTDEALFGYLAGLVEGATADASLPATSETVEFVGLEPGYYVIKRGNGQTNAVTITTAKPDATVIDKNMEPGTNLEKKVQVDSEWKDANTVGIGDTINWQVTFTATNYDGDKKVEYYQVTDTLSPNKWAEIDSTSIKVYFYDEVNSEWVEINLDDDDVTLDATTGGFSVKIPWMDGGVFKYPATTDVKLTYSAVVKAPAASDNAAVNINNVEVNWDTDDEGDTPDNEPSDTPGDKTDTKVYNLGISKVDGTTNNGLAGAKFILTDADGNTVKVSAVDGKTGVYVVDPESTNSTIVSPDGGQIIIEGLKEGTYSLTETEAPAGYNKVENAISITVAATTTDNTTFAGYTVNGSTEVKNFTGVELPSTGGKGTMMLITFGTMVAVAFAVLMITQKKMSIYND